MTRPLTTTSGDNGWAVGAYATAIALGVIHAAELTPMRSITGFFHGTPGVKVWALAVVAAGLVGLTAIHTQRRRADPTDWIWVELAAAGSLLMLYPIYVLALISALGIAAVPTTQVLLIGPTVGAVVRVVQILRDQRRVHLSRAHPVPADPPPAGDPTDRS